MPISPLGIRRSMVTCDESHYAEDDKHYDYGQKNVRAYAEYGKDKHGADGGLFLDPYFTPLIRDLTGERVLDIGCGAGPWSIYAAHQGGIVSGIDIQQGMIDAARKATEVAKLSDKIQYLVGDAANLPYEGGLFDRAISICVGCNLPPEIFRKHIEEIGRVLKQGGMAAISAPSSLHIVFTNGIKSEAEVHQHIQEVLDALPNNPTRKEIAEKLSELNEVFSATFYIRDSRLTLLTSASELKEGEKIWRKLPKPVVPNYYYRNESYQRIFEELGLNYKVYLPHFSSEEARAEYNTQAPENEYLGPAYVSNSPFVTFEIVK